MQAVEASMLDQKQLADAWGLGVLTRRYTLA
ncbi:hypothetical protein [Enterobacter phage 04_vB_Eclo_IJM]|nr:hypothetical protein [Enterobacter phage 04_vB_Eclo_IJM]